MSRAAPDRSELNTDRNLRDDAKWNPLHIVEEGPLSRCDQRGVGPEQRRVVVSTTHKLSAYSVYRVGRGTHSHSGSLPSYSIRVTRAQRER